MKFEEVIAIIRNNSVFTGIGRIGTDEMDFDSDFFESSENQVTFNVEDFNADDWVVYLRFMDAFKFSRGTGMPMYKKGCEKKYYAREDGVNLVFSIDDIMCREWVVDGVS